MLNSKLYRRGAIKKKVPYLLILRYYWRNLAGTAGSWFLYDAIAFSNSVFSGTIISSVVSTSNNIQSTAEWQLLLGAIALPGVLIGAYLCNRIGRKNTMMLGFAGYLVGKPSKEDSTSAYEFIGLRAHSRMCLRPADDQQVACTTLHCALRSDAVKWQPRSRRHARAIVI